MPDTCAGEGGGEMWGEVGGSVESKVAWEGGCFYCSLQTAAAVISSEYVCNQCTMHPTTSMQHAIVSTATHNV